MIKGKVLFIFLKKIYVKYFIVITLGIMDKSFQNNFP